MIIIKYGIQKKFGYIIKKFINKINNINYYNLKYTEYK